MINKGRTSNIKTTHAERPMHAYVRVCIFLLALTSYNFALAQTNRTKISQAAPAKVGRAKRDFQIKSCQVSVSGSGLSEGDLAEIIDDKNQQVALVKMERVKKTDSRLVATVLNGQEKCDQLKGLTLRPLGTSNVFIPQPKNPHNIINRVFFVSPKYAVSQTALPGMALNKFLTPGYTQRGFSVSGIGLFPREPIRMAGFLTNFSTELNWTSQSTAPSIDIVKDGKVEGTQAIASQNIHVRVGSRFHFRESRTWTGAGLILFDRMKTSSSVESSNNEKNSAAPFKVIRDLESQGFGLYGEQGFVINGSTNFILSLGVGIGTSMKTPVEEDGDATNSTATVRLDGVPLFAGAKLQLPLMQLIYSEFNADYRKVMFTIPLINNGTSKAQVDVVSVSAGIGVSY